MSNMNIFEFELRFIAFKWISKKFKLKRDQDTLLQLVKISAKWVPKKKIQDISPQELKEITLATYSNFKKKFISDSNEITLKYASLADYIERLEYELKVIKEMWFNTYMLIVADFCNRARANEIVVWPWRWSWAWSLLAWVIGITDVDPFAYNLLFERFLNPARVSMPDLDIDFEDTLREKVIEYVTQKYGADKVCYIWTYMKLATKAAFKDTARAIWIPFDRANKVSSAIPEKTSLKDIINLTKENEEIKTLYNNDEKIKEAIDLGSKVEGNLRQTWVHACWIIIAPMPVSNYTAIQPMWKWHDGFVSQFDWPTLETIWLLKMDFLWLRNLSVIKNTIKIIAARLAISKKGENILYEWLSAKAIEEYKSWELPQIFSDFLESMQFEPPLEDNYTFEKVFQTWDTSWIFQFEWQGMRRFLVQLKATDINDLIAMSALYRPGPLDFIPTYIKRKHGQEEIDYMLPELKTELEKQYPNEKNLVEEERKKLIEDLDPIMGITYWIAVYQEQLMFMVQSMAWFSLPEADLLRRWIWKKKQAVIDQLKKEFVERSQSFRGYKPETWKIIYEKMIEPAASYSFNKSHAACYSLIAYQTGYLKAHYPLEFYAALLRSVEEDTDKLSFFVDEVLTAWLQIVTPSVNKSYNHIAALNNQVRVGFLACKWIGYSVWEFIEKERKANGLFSSLEDFLKRSNDVINKKSLESLIKSWALDEFQERNTMLENLNMMLDWTKNADQSDWGLFGGMVSTDIQFPETRKATAMEKLLMEYDIFKTFIGWHPFDWLYPMFKKSNFISQFKEVPDAWEFHITAFIKKIQRARKKWFFVTIEDSTDSIDIFLKEMLDIKLFDIFHIKGYKWRSVSIDQMVKISHEELIDKAKRRDLYDESRTIAKVKYTRKSDKSLNALLHQPDIKETLINNDNNGEDDIDIENDETESINEWTNISDENQVYKFPLPESMSTLQNIIKIINDNSGTISIQFGNKSLTTNQNWLDQIQKLLQ